MSIDSVLTALGNQVRRLAGGTDALTLAEMTAALEGVTEGVDVTGADAAPSQVLAGKKFVGAAGALETGAMVNRGAVEKTLTTTDKTYTVPAGYHDGNGKVQAVTQTKSVTPTTSAQTVYPDAGKFLSAVTVAASTGKQVYTGRVSMNFFTNSINVGVSLDDNDAFFIFGTEAFTSTVQNGGGFWGAKYIGFNKVFQEQYDSSLEDSIPMPTENAISYSGTTVTVGAMQDSWYRWVIIKGGI